MNRILSGAVVFLFFIGLNNSGKGANSKTGTTGYQFLKIGIGARAIAMGGAFVGLSDDESALYYNPAGLLAIERRAVTTSYVNYIADIQSGFIGYVHSIASNRRLGTALNYFNYGNFIGLDKSGLLTGDFTSVDLAFSVAYAVQLKSGVQVGFAPRWVYEKIENYSSTGLMTDLGWLYKFKDGRTQVGMLVQNIGFQLSGLTSSHKDGVPWSVRIGFSHRLHGLPLVFDADIIKPSDNDIFLNLGTEFTKLEPVRLRLGWSSFGSELRTADGENKTLTGIAGGFGVRFPGPAGRQQSFQVDYAFVPYADLGSVHRVTVGARF